MGKKTLNSKRDIIVANSKLKPITELSQVPEGFKNFSEVCSLDYTLYNKILQAGHSGKVAGVKLIRTVGDKAGPIWISEEGLLKEGLHPSQNPPKEPQKAPEATETKEANPTFKETASVRPDVDLEIKHFSVLLDDVLNQIGFLKQVVVEIDKNQKDTQAKLSFLLKEWNGSGPLDPKDPEAVKALTEGRRKKSWFAGKS